MADDHEAIISLHCMGKLYVTIAKNINVNLKIVRKDVMQNQEKGDAMDHHRSGIPQIVQPFAKVKAAREKIWRYPQCFSRNWQKRAIWLLPQ